MKYGSEESKELSHHIACLMMDKSYNTSAHLAKEKGRFKLWNKKVLKTPFIQKLDTPTRNLIKKHGLRNIAMLTIAPTGTTSFSLGQNCSSGIVPMFALQYDRNIKTGKGDETKQETVYDHAWLEYLEIHPETKLEDAPEYFVTVPEIDVHDSIEIQSIWQKYIDHSISKTLNLPPGTSFREYEDLFMEAYDAGLKGFTTFNPEGSMKGVLEYSKKDNKKESDTNRPEKMIETMSPKRPKELECDIFEIKVSGEKHVVLVGMLGSKPYEIFVTPNPDGEFNLKHHKTGIIKKAKKGKYDLIIKNGTEKTFVKDITGSFDSEYCSLARMLSMSLRHGVPIEFIVDQLSKDKNFASFEKTVMRVLKKYIEEGSNVRTSNDIKCGECGGVMVFRDGCVVCSSCGWSKCG